MFHLKIVFKSKEKKKKKLSVNKPQNKVLRYLAYKKCILWINASTANGKGMKIVIPSSAIRTT